MVPPGELREIRKRDPLTNTIKEIQFIGQDCFVRSMMPPSRRALGFLSDNGRFKNPGGRYL
jgi:hypothetical protein